MGYKVATRLLPVSTFWPAENYHQTIMKTKEQLPTVINITKYFDAQ